MLDGWIGAIALVAGLLGYGWLRSEFESRIPSRIVNVLSRFGSKSFGAYGDVTEFWISELKVQYVNEWEAGHELNVIAKGTVLLATDSTDDDAEKPARIYLQFFPKEEAYPNTDQIGWGTAREHEEHGKYVSVSLLLRGSIIASFVNELRHSQEQRLAITGFENEYGRIVITAIHMSPN